jgi:hypothetical protein
MSLETWSGFDARWAEILVKLQRRFTDPKAGSGDQGPNRTIDTRVFKTA